ncbi:ABC transporter permease [Streptomyces sp. NPDC085460]|uniref:ABC transporter permease n=1 Tax=Streptomyces sp. NPDC085460 TaxID=3365723 RepID=UPI0037D68866
MSRHLIRIGRAAGSRAEAGRIRFVALVAATFVLAIGFASLVATHATYQGQDLRGLARGPVLQEDRPDRPARALWGSTNDSVRGSGVFSVIFIAPLTDDAPLPPGLSRWPGPGEAVLSPGLLAKGADDGIGQRYGRVVGEVARDGLQSPDELLAYVRPRTGLTPANAAPIVGYGPDQGYVSRVVGQSRYAKDEWTFQAMPGALLLLPAGVLLVVAARSGAHGRDRRTALVEVLGGTTRSRALIVLGEAWTPVAVGGALALVAVIASWTTDLRLPWTGHVLNAADMRAWWWALLLSVVVAAAAVLLGTVGSDRWGRARGTGNRPSGARRSPVRWAVLCPVLLLVAVRGPDLFEPGSAPYLMVNWAAAAGTLATLPAAVAVVTGHLGRQMARAGRRLGSPGLLVAGQRAATHPGPVARMTAGVVVALGLLIQVVAWQGQFGQATREAQATVQRIGSSALVLQPGKGSTAPQMTRFLEALPPDVEAVALLTSPEEDSLTVLGSCPSLTALSLPCSTAPSRLRGVPEDPRMAELVGWYGVGRKTTVLVRQADPVDSATGADAISHTVLVSLGRQDIPANDAKRLAYEAFPRGAEVHPIGGEWLVSSQVNTDQGRWIALFGLFGIMVLAGAAAITGTAEFLRNGRALAPLSVLSGNRRVYGVTAAWSLLVPLALAGLAGITVGTWLAFPKTTDGASYISGGLLVACAAVVAALGVVAWGWATTVSARQAADWRPRGE